MNGNHYSREGKRLITLAGYAHLLTSIDLDNCNKIHPLGMLTGNADDYYAVQVEGNKFRLMPGPEFDPWLYRGQTHFHDNCKASTYRNKEYSGLILDHIKLFEFIKLLSNSPVVQRMRGLTILDNQLSIDFEGLAQHYGLSTDMLDFTRSRDIAMFFASCKVNDITNQYEPILDETTEAVLYTLDIAQLYIPTT